LWDHDRAGLLHLVYLGRAVRVEEPATALARAVDDAALDLGHKFLNRQVETPGDQRRTLLQQMPVSISFAVSVMSALSLAES
jgi:hypothetical protein